MAQKKSSESEQKWIVKDSEGKIFGPFTTDQVLEQIDRNYFLGSELVASYPGGEWIAISKTPQFYDRLLDVLAAEIGGQESNPTSLAAREVTFRDVIDTPAVEITPTPEPTKPTVTVSTKSSLTDSLRNAVSPSHQAKTQTRSQALQPAGHGLVIELTDLKWLERKEKDKNARLPFIIIGISIFLVVASMFFTNEAPTNDGRMRLSAPRRGQPELAEEKLKEKFRKAMTSFYTDTFSGYQRAQSELIEVVEGASTKPEKGLAKAEMLSYLCLVYRELWPYAVQDSKDLKTISSAQLEARRLDPGGVHGAICTIVQNMMANKYRDAQGTADTSLLEESQHPVLFELRGDIYAYAHDYPNAATYFNQALTLWPQWNKTAVQEGRARGQLREYPKAIQLYRGVLQRVPRHSVAKIELGLIEGLEVNQFDKGLELLKAGVDDGEKAPRPILSSGYFGMAWISQRKNRRDQAIDYAKRALTLNPANVEAEKLLKDLGVAAETKTKTAKGAECMYLGDQYVRQGDCFAAQAEFKACYEADPKNAVAAMKAGKCLWQLNQSLEAIDWMKKAMNSDRMLISAYTELSDYYAQRFDFYAAIQILTQAQQRQPQAFEVYRGFAQVELRRNNFKGAIGYSTRALKIYETDLETTLIMAKAQVGLQEFHEAKRYVARAIELDYNNTEAHSLFAKAQSALLGVDAGANYLEMMINKYVITRGKQIPQPAIDYRVALGEIYLQDERYKQAEDAFRQAISLDPNNKTALVNLGKCYQAQNQANDALESYLKAAVLDPSDANPIFLSGQLYAETGKTLEAFRQFERVLKINNRYPKAQVAIGRVALRAGDPKKALEAAMQERTVNPDLADSYVLAAEAYFELKQYQNCAGEYQKAVSKRGQGAATLVRMARCYRLAGAIDSAQSLLRQASMLESGNPDLYKEMGAIFHTKGMADDAISNYDRYLMLNPSALDRGEIEMRIKRVQRGDLSVGE